MNFENELKIGNGIYTISDISQILKLPYSRVSVWVNKYWDGELGQEFKNKYSWSVDNSKAVSFHTLIEFYVFYMLAESGVKTRKVLKAHKELSQMFKTFFPFAKQNILNFLHSDSKGIYIDIDGTYMSLDGSKQFNLKFIEMFFKNLDFDNELIASRLWPMGKDKSILVDPKRQFGHPIINHTNIFPETLFNLYKGGESVDFIAFTYEIDKKHVIDAIEFCKAA